MISFSFFPQATILSFDFLEDYLPQLAMFEKIDLLHRIYPVSILGGGESGR